MLKCENVVGAPVGKRENICKARRSTLCVRVIKGERDNAMGRIVCGGSSVSVHVGREWKRVDMSS